MRLLSSRNTISLLALSILFVSRAFAATLSIVPPSVTAEEGRPFTVSFYVSNNRDSFNAVSAQFSYSKEILKFNSFSRVDSILQMWSVEPRVDSFNGTGSFEGVVLNPGFSGTRGLLVKASFTPLKKGVATISFTSGNIYANDGSATDVLSILGKTEVTVTETKQTKRDIAKEYSVAPVLDSTTKQNEKGSISISSKTHPSESMWYSGSEVKFSLGIDPLATDMSTAFSLEDDIADRVRSKPEAERSYNVSTDGAYLFLVKQKIKNIWSKDARYKVHVDTTPPYEVMATFPLGATSTKMHQEVTLAARDALSGVSRYEVSLNKDKAITELANSDGTVTVFLPKVKRGENVLMVTAYDMARNSKQIAVSFMVNSFENPKVIFFTKEVKPDSFFTLKAETYPKGTLLLTLQSKDELLQKRFAADDGGRALISFPLTKTGVYDAKIQLVDFEDGESDEVVVGKVSVLFSLMYLMKTAIKEDGLLLFATFLLVILSSILTYLITRSKLRKETSVQVAAVILPVKEKEGAVKQEPVEKESSPQSTSPTT